MKTEGGVAGSESGDDDVLEVRLSTLCEGVPDNAVVTGLGLITALGGDAEETWKNLLAGSSALSPGGRCEVARLHNQHVGEVRNFRLS